MPGFIKTARDEKIWSKAKERAKGNYQLANWLYHKMKAAHPSGALPKRYSEESMADQKKKKCSCAAGVPCNCWAFAPFYGDGHGHSGATFPKNNVIPQDQHELPRGDVGASSEMEPDGDADDAGAPAPSAPSGGGGGAPAGGGGVTASLDSDDEDPITEKPEDDMKESRLTGLAALNEALDPSDEDDSWANLGKKQNKHIIVVHQVAKTKWRVTYLNPQGGSFSNQDATSPEKGKMLGIAKMSRSAQDVLDHIKHHQGGKVPVYSEAWDFAAGEPGPLKHMGDFPVAGMKESRLTGLAALNEGLDFMTRMIAAPVGPAIAVGDPDDDPNTNPMMSDDVDDKQVGFAPQMGRDDPFAPMSYGMDSPEDAAEDCTAYEDPDYATGFEDLDLDLEPEDGDDVDYEASQEDVLGAALTIMNAAMGFK